MDLDHMEEEKWKELFKIRIQVGETPGHTEVIHHNITLKDLKPICQPVYRVPEHLLPVLKRELELLRNCGT